jgi:hypothetical protein
MNTSKHYRLRVVEFYSVVHRILILLMITGYCLPAATYGAQREKLVVLPFEIVDNTPVAGGGERNQKMLDKLTYYISRSISAEGLFEVVPQSEVNEMMSSAQLGTYIRTCNECELDLAKRVDGDKVMTGWIYKMSILILTMHVKVKDVRSEETIVSKAYDFRGDNEKAWLRAAKYMLRDLYEIMGQRQ